MKPTTKLLPIKSGGIKVQSRVFQGRKTKYFGQWYEGYLPAKIKEIRL